VIALADDFGGEDRLELFAVRVYDAAILLFSDSPANRRSLFANGGWIAIAQSAAHVYTLVKAPREPR
jgi:hypothetical protein